MNVWLSYKKKNYRILISTSHFLVLSSQLDERRFEIQYRKVFPCQSLSPVGLLCVWPVSARPVLEARAPWHRATRCSLDGGLFEERGSVRTRPLRQVKLFRAVSLKSKDAHGTKGNFLMSRTSNLPFTLPDSQTYQMFVVIPYRQTKNVFYLTCILIMGLSATKTFCG